MNEHFWLYCAVYQSRLNTAKGGAVIIKVEHIFKAYGEKKVLTDLSLSFERGKFHCIAGPSGVGKTTLFRILMGLEQPDSGSISGFDKGRVSVVFQENRLCESLSAGANIRLVMPELADKRIPAELLQAFGLPDVLHMPVREMSGGMQRRVALARALAVNSEVFLFDEAFTGLDRETRDMVIAETGRRIAGKTLLMITHDETEAELLGAKVIKL